MHTHKHKCTYEHNKLTQTISLSHAYTQRDKHTEKWKDREMADRKTDRKTDRHNSFM